MSAIGRARAGMFWRGNQFRFPGNGRMPVSVLTEPQAAPQEAEGEQLPCGEAREKHDDYRRKPVCGDFRGGQNLTGEFTELLNAPEYDQRATAVAREEA